MAHNAGLFDSYFQMADLDSDGRISVAEAVSFFQASGLPELDLAKIWDYADQNRTGFLGRAEFYNALRLVTVAQSKRELTPEVVKAALYGPAAAKIPAPQMTLPGTPASPLNTAQSRPVSQSALGNLVSSQSVGPGGPLQHPIVSPNPHMPQTNQMMRPSQSVSPSPSTLAQAASPQGFQAAAPSVSARPPTPSLSRSLAAPSTFQHVTHGARGRPPRPSTGPLAEDVQQPAQQNVKIPILKKDLEDQLSSEEKKCLNSKLQEAMDADKKVIMWLDYLRSVQNNGSPNEVRYLFERALVRCDSFDVHYKKLSEAYREFEQSLLTEEGKEIGVKRIRILFDRQLRQPLANQEDTLLACKSWEAEYGILLHQQHSCTITDKMEFCFVWDVTKCKVPKGVDKIKLKEIRTTIQEIFGMYYGLPKELKASESIICVGQHRKDINMSIWGEKCDFKPSGYSPKNSTTKTLISCVAGSLVGTVPSETALIILSDGTDRCAEDLSNLLMRLDMQGYKRLIIVPKSNSSQPWSSMNMFVHDWEDVKARVGLA